MAFGLFELLHTAQRVKVGSQRVVLALGQLVDFEAIRTGFFGNSPYKVMEGGTPTLWVVPNSFGLFWYL